LDALPYITPQTVAYALSLVMLCVCYSVADPMTKGRAAQLFKKILENYSKLSAKEYQDILRASVTDWVAKVTAPEPAGPEVPVMSLQEVAAADKRRPSSAAAASAAAVAAAAAPAAPAEGGAAAEGGASADEGGAAVGNGDRTRSSAAAAAAAAAAAEDCAAEGGASADEGGAAGGKKGKPQPKNAKNRRA
jgi:hypothetical protein